MALFGKQPEVKPQPLSSAAAPAADRRGPAWIAPGCKLVGSVGGSADVRIDGEVEGEVKLETSVTIGPGGLVRGGIVARNVCIGGRVHGNVRGSERVELLAAGQLEGDVSAPRVIIAEGAFFKGKVEMTGQNKAPVS